MSRQGRTGRRVGDGVAARDEAAGRRPQRLTEANLATWARFRGRLGGRDLVRLLFEDAAVLHPVPFDPAAMGEDSRSG